MSHHRLPSLTALVMFSISMFCSAEGRPVGPGEAAGRATASQRADFAVVVWYRHSDPLGTFKFEFYDIRKGEYTAKVDEWIKDVRAKYPDYYVVLRKVDLAREKGETELLNVGSVVNRELVVASARAGIVIGPGRIDSRQVGYGVFGGAPAAGSERDSGLGRLPGAPSVNRDYLKQSPTASSIPPPILNRPR